MVTSENHTVEPTYTSAFELLVKGFNARAGWEWQAFPGRELVTPLTSANGLGVKLQHASDTSLFNATLHFME